MPPWLSVSRSELLNEGVSLDYVEMWSGPMKGKKLAKPRPLVRPNTPAQPAAFNAWAKPDVLLVCGECQEEWQAED